MCDDHTYIRCGCIKDIFFLQHASLPGRFLETGVLARVEEALFQSRHSSSPSEGGKRGELGMYSLITFQLAELRYDRGGHTCHHDDDPKQNIHKGEKEFSQGLQSLSERRLVLRGVLLPQRRGSSQLPLVGMYVE